MLKTCFSKKDLKEFDTGKPLDDKCVRLSLSENLWGPSSKALFAVFKGIKHINLYPENSYYNLRNLIATVYNLDIDQVFIGNGSDELIMLLILTFFKPGDVGVTSTVTFAGFRLSIMNASGLCFEVPISNFLIDVESLIKKTQELIESGFNVVALYVCNPNNPTGTVISEGSIEKLMKFSEEKNIYLIFDEAYMEYASKERTVSATNFIKDYNKVIVLRTFSKFYGLAGLRCGYILSNKNIIKQVKMLRHSVVFNVNRLAYIAAFHSLLDKTYAKKTYSRNVKIKKFFMQGLTKLGIEYVNTETNFILIKIGDNQPDFYEFLIAHNVYVMPCDKFGLKEYIRVGIGRLKDIKYFLNLLQLYKRRAAN